MKRPITIIGGGLSGLALGCYLQKKGVTVTIIEQGTYPRHKVCGEFICGVSKNTLSELEISKLFAPAESVKNIKWHIADKKILDKELPYAAAGISRFMLDHELQKHFQDLGGIIKQKRINKANYLNKPNEGVVWACGKEKTGRGNDTTRWLGMKIHAIDIDVDSLEMHTGGRAAKGGYIGLSPIENGRVNICGLFEVNKKVTGKGSEKLLQYLKTMGLSKLALKIENATIDEDSFSAVAGFSMGHQQLISETQSTVMPIGDSALLIPPFTGNGMSIALESALLAGKNLLPYCDHLPNYNWENTRTNYLNSLRKQFRKRLTAAKIIHPFFFHPLGKSCLNTLAKGNLIPFKALFHLLR